MNELYRAELCSLLVSLDFNSRAAVKTKQDCRVFLRAHAVLIPEELKSFINAIIDACDGESALLMSWLFYKETPAISRTAFVNLNLHLREVLGLHHISLKDFKFNERVDLSDTSIFQLVDFSQAKKIQKLRHITQPTYIYRFARDEKIIHAKFSFAYLQTLARTLLYEYAILKRPVLSLNAYVFVVASSSAQHLSEKERLFHREASVLLVRFIHLIQTENPAHQAKFILTLLGDHKNKYTLAELHQQLLQSLTPLHGFIAPLKQHSIHRLDTWVTAHYQSRGCRVTGLFYISFLAAALCLSLHSGAVPSINSLFLALLTLLPFFGVSLNRIISLFSLFILMPLQLLAASYLASEFIEYRVLGMDRQTTSLGLMLAAAVPVCDMIYAGYHHFFLQQERQAYIAAGRKLINPRATAPYEETSSQRFKNSPRIQSMLAFLLQSKRYLFWMTAPYVSTFLVAHLFGLQAVSTQAKLFFGATLSYIKCGVSLLCLLLHIHKNSQATDVIGHAFEKNKIVYWAVEFFASVLMLGLDQGVRYLHAPAQTNLLTTRSLNEPRPFYKYMRSAIHPYSVWNVMLIGRAMPDAAYVNTPSFELMPFFMKNNATLASIATPWSLSQGMAALISEASLVDNNQCGFDGWQMLYYSERQCPLNILHSFFYLLGEKLKLLSVLHQTENSLIAKDIGHSTPWFFVRVPEASLTLTCEDLQTTTQALMNFSLFAFRALSLEAKAQPKVVLNHSR